MEFVQRVLLYITATAVICLLIGLFKPWVMVWWEDNQNRKRVFMVYGTAAAVGYTLYWAFHLI